LTSQQVMLDFSTAYKWNTALW